MEDNDRVFRCFFKRKVCQFYLDRLIIKTLDECFSDNFDADKSELYVLKDSRDRHFNVFDRKGKINIGEIVLINDLSPFGCCSGEHRMQDNNDLMTMKEMVKYIRTNRFTLMKWIQDEYIPASKIGHRWFFSKKAVDEFIKNKQNGGR